jgi:hypothetical protein
MFGLSLSPDPEAFVRGSCVYPFHEIIYIRMGEQTLESVVLLLQFLLGKHGMDKTVAGRTQENNFVAGMGIHGCLSALCFSVPGPRDKMMPGEILNISPAQAARGGSTVGIRPHCAPGLIVIFIFRKGPDGFYPSIVYI